MLKDSESPLTVDEVINSLRERWNHTYDLRLVIRSKNLYLQMMWAYLEQQSFPLNEDEYRVRLNEVVEVINRIGLAGSVREWLLCSKEKPIVGKAISLRLQGAKGLEEFVL